MDRYLIAEPAPIPGLNCLNVLVRVLVRPLPHAQLEVKRSSWALSRTADIMLSTLVLAQALVGPL